MGEKILFVDDDTNILAAYRRQLHKHFQIDTASGGPQGLEAIAARGPYAVIVSDMRMPDMDGVQFLAHAGRLAPDTVRMMLTGCAELGTAINAVNEGHIFRFLTKPCPAETLTRALAAGVAQYRLVVAERELLERTLRGSVQVLTEILGLINPIAFIRSSRIQSVVRHIAEQLDLPDRWQYDLAAMLCQIGCVTLSPETLEAIYAGQKLSPQDQQRFADHPVIAGRLLANIPRLEAVGEMIARQNQPFGREKPAADAQRHDPVSVGAQILHVSFEFDQLLSRGMAPAAAVAELLRRGRDCDPAIVATLRTIRLSEMDTETRWVGIGELAIHMVLDEDVRSKNGLLLVAKGQQVTYPLLERLRSFRFNDAISGRVRVRVPRDTVPNAADAPVNAHVKEAV